MESTAAAARTVALLGGNRAAIATRRAAGIFGLNILLSAIQDGNGDDKYNNVTRFVVISPADHPPTGNDKTSIILSIKMARAVFIIFWPLCRKRYQPDPDRITPGTKNAR